jgi:hypothetical protein
MQPLKKYKFLQEQVFEGIWLFNRFTSTTKVLLLLLLYTTWGFILYVYYLIPLPYLIAGGFGALGLFGWTIGIFRYADKLRNVEIERINAVNRKFLIGFLEDLFHPSSLMISILVFSAILTYLFSSTSFGIENILGKLQGEINVTTLPPLLLLFVILLAFDLCYRLGLSLYVILMQIRRDLRLAKYLRSPLLKTHFSPVDIRNLEYADYFHLLAICSGFMLIPLCSMDPFLMLAILVYLTLAFSLATFNSIYLRILYIRSFPQGLSKLLYSTRFANVATVSPNKYPHITPTLFVFDGRNVYVVTSISSQKVKNLRRTSNISIFIDSHQHEEVTKSFGVSITGRARIYGYNVWTGILYFLIFGFRMVRVYFLFKKKYPHYLSQYQKENRNLPFTWRIYPLISRTIIEVIPDQFSFWKASRSTLIRF